MISELRDSSPVFWSIGSGGKAPLCWSQRGYFNSWLVLERDDGRGSARRDRRRERLSTSTVHTAPWSWAALVRSGGTLRPQGRENSGHGAVVLRDAVR